MNARRTSNILVKLACLGALSFSVATTGCASAADDVQDEGSFDTGSSEDALTRGAIVVQHSIRGVTLNMSTHGVRQTLGAPDSISYARNEIIGATKIYRYGLTTIVFSNDNVLWMDTTSKKLETASGVGIGSSETAVLNRVNNSQCKTVAGYRSCWVGNRQPGKVVTNFAIRGGHVISIGIGPVID